MQALDIDEQIANGVHPNTLELRPTLIVVPNSLIDTWYREITKFFKDTLHIRQYYSNEFNVKDINRKANTLPSNAKAAANKVRTAFPSNDARNARVVVLTAYETFAQRIRIQGKKELQKGENQHPPLFFFSLPFPLRGGVPQTEVCRSTSTRHKPRVVEGCEGD
jgi:SNF2 family DNA or RNA helicase